VSSAGRSLHGKVVVITGAARGIGRATAAALVAEGARVVIGDLDGALAADTAAELGAGTVGRPLDVTDHDAFRAFLDDVERDIGPIDILINNARIMPAARFEEEAQDSTLRQVEVNFLAPLFGTREAIRRMRPRGHGHIINVASMAGVVPTPGASTYSATKHAVVGLTESVAWELRGSGIDIGCVLPVLVNTDLASGIARTRASRTIEPVVVAREIVKALRKPKLRIYAPASMGTVTKWSGLLPRRVGDKIMVATGSDHLISDAITSTERAAYEARVAASAPGAQRRAEERRTAV
jgi:NAD(P)-dependent dehydrogenase (short-subunit alcohol dehydrogenase family)